MKVSIVQPFYSMNYADADVCFREMLSQMDSLDESSDLIVLPEYCDIPVSTPGKDEFHSLIEKYNPVIRERVPALARRCSAMVFANYAEKSPRGWRNATHAFNRKGEEVGIYYKAHPAPSEVKTKAEGGNELDCSYSYSYEKPYVLELEGIRFGFMTCYDFYMYEAFSRLAQENVDVIIGCSHQRTDTHTALNLIGRFLSYNTNAYLVRSAVSLGEKETICGSSMVVASDGKILLNMESRIGVGSAEFNPHKKYLKPAGFLGKEKSHWEYIDEGRRPWLYRPAGSMMVPTDKDMPYPRICAHRGFSTVAPENSMPAYGAAVALGAEEIEFDLWTSKDGYLVSTHDPSLDRTSTGSGNVYDYTLEELERFDFGVKTGPRFKGLRIIRFEEILKKFACTCIMNIHVKIWDRPDMDHCYEKIAALLRQYGCEKHCYMMSSTDRSLEEFHAVAPEIALCIGWNGEKDDNLALVNRALKVGAKKVQLFKPYFDQSSVDYAHENGIICNVFFSDEPGEARRFADMGIDCILTNDYLTISNALRKEDF